ncbi:hypothetical protein BH11PLA2_BH11PLA2_22340 [soil metagenome]
MIRTAIRVVLFTLLLAPCGCGGDRMHPVHGLVTVDGHPLSGAGIVFVPADGQGKTAYAETESDGTFLVRTEVPSDGVRAGEYTVTVTWEEPQHPYLRYRDNSPKKKELEQDYLKWKATHKTQPSPVPKIYTEPATTPLKVRVPLEGGELKIELKSAS